VRPGAYLTEEQVERMTSDQLADWSDGEALSPWEPNSSPPPARQASVPTMLALPGDLAAELRAEAALHEQPYVRYLEDLLLLALRTVQANRTPDKDQRVPEAWASPRV
jgi:hypothetical protein